MRISDWSSDVCSSYLAESDDDRGVEVADQADSHAPPLADRERRLEPADRAAMDAPGGQDVRFHLGRRAGNLEAPVVADERDAVAARDQFACKRISRKHMSPRPAGGEKEVARCRHYWALISCSSFGSSIPEPHRGLDRKSTRLNSSH